MEEKKVNMYSDFNSTIHLYVTNMESFKELIEQAEKQACELKNTISKLEGFNIEFKFYVDEN